MLDTAAKLSNLESRTVKDGIPDAQVRYFVAQAFKAFEDRNKKHPTLFNTQESMAQRIQENLSARGVTWTLMDVKEAGRQSVEHGSHASIARSLRAPKPDPDHPESRSATDWASLYHEQESIMQSVKAERDSLRQELELNKHRLRKSTGASKPVHDTIEAAMQDAFATIDFPLVLDLAQHPAAAKIPPTILQLYVAAANHMLGKDALAGKLFHATAHCPGADRLLLTMASTRRQMARLATHRAVETLPERLAGTSTMVPKEISNTSRASIDGI